MQSRYQPLSCVHALARGIEVSVTTGLKPVVTERDPNKKLRKTYACGHAKAAARLHTANPQAPQHPDSGNQTKRSS